MARFVLLLMVSLFIISEIPSIESMTRMDDGKLNNLIAFTFIYENCHAHSSLTLNCL